MDVGRVYVYAADTAGLKDPAMFAKGFPLVSKQRQEKISRFVFAKDKVLSLGAGLLLRQCLKEHGVENPEFEVGEYGKPYLKVESYLKQEKSNLQHEESNLKQQNSCLKQGKPFVKQENPYKKQGRLYFNLSHSGQRVMCAISDMEVGCDVEEVTEADADVAEKFFSCEEYIRFAAARTQEARNDLFFRFWTRRESYLKAIGVGLDIPFSSSRWQMLSSSSGRNMSLSSSRWNMGRSSYGENMKERGGYYFQEYDRGDGYRYAVCSRAGNIDENIRMVNLLCP